MKGLFLDFDGVLNSSGSCIARTSSRWSWYDSDEYNELHVNLTEMVGEFPYLVTHTLGTIDPTAVELVNRLFEKEPELKLILSTSHRALFGNFGWGTEQHLEALSIYCRMLGLRKNVFGITPNLRGRRGLEVAAFLAEHPEIERHCAIDDGADFAPEDCTFHLIDPSVGFTGTDYYQLTRHLIISESNIIV